MLVQSSLDHVQRAANDVKDRMKNQMVHMKQDMTTVRSLLSDMAEALRNSE